MFVALIVSIVILGSVAFHMWSPWWWSEIASNWVGMDNTIILTFWITGAVFVAICFFVAYCVWKFEYNKNRRAEYKPEDKKLESRLTWITSFGVAALLAPGLVVWNNYVTVPENAYKVEVFAYQWGWKYRLPGDDGVLGKTDIKYINDDKDCIFERQPLQNLSKDSELMAFKHEGFWHPMDTLRDKKILNDLLQKRKAPWVI